VFLEFVRSRAETRRYEGIRLLRLGPPFRYTWVTDLGGLAYPQLNLGGPS
jgi:hypothetical protein